MEPTLNSINLSISRYDLILHASEQKLLMCVAAGPSSIQNRAHDPTRPGPEACLDPPP